MNRFGETARGLAQNPLGIIALFIVLVYGFASLVVGIGANLDSTSTIILVWFMVLFPVLVLAVFAWLVSRHHTKLYSPKDYDKSREFWQLLAPGVRFFPHVATSPTSQPPPKKSIRGEQISEELSGETNYPSTPAGRDEERDNLYAYSDGVFIVHVLAPSNREGQEFDVFIYLKRHKDKPISVVTKAEFFFGERWGNRIIEGQREGNVIGVRLSAYAPFLCTCRVTFENGNQASLYRYIDFEMGRIIAEAAIK